MISIHYNLMQLDPSTLRDHCGYAKKIIDIVSGRFCVPVDELKARSRKREIVECRQVAIWIIKKKTRLSLSQIGKLFDRDHSTVLFSINSVNTFIETRYPAGLLATQILNDL